MLSFKCSFTETFSINEESQFYLTLFDRFNLKSFHDYTFNECLPINNLCYRCRTEFKCFIYQRRYLDKCDTFKILCFPSIRFTLYILSSIICLLDKFFQLFKIY